MCLCARMLVLEWKERVFIEKVNSRCFFLFPAAISVHQNGTPIWLLHTKLYKGAWDVLANNSETVGHKDLRPGKIVYYISLFITFFFLCFFHWTLSNLFFCCVTVKTIYESSETCSQILRYCSIHWGSNKNGVNPDRQGCCYPPADYWFQAIMEITTERKSQWSNW